MLRLAFHPLVQLISPTISRLGLHQVCTRATDYTELEGNNLRVGSRWFFRQRPRWSNTSDESSQAGTPDPGPPRAIPHGPLLQTLEEH